MTQGGKRERLARECAGCTRARQFICWAIRDPIGMFRDNESCFAYTTDRNWYGKYDAAVKAYKKGYRGEAVA